MTGEPLWEEDLRSGSHWSGVLRRGTTLRLTDVDGGANVAALFYNYEDRLERYNMADTLKAQHTAYLTKGTSATPTWGGSCARLPRTPAAGTTRWPASRTPRWSRTSTARTRFQEQRNGFYKNGYDGLLGELGKYGLGKRDIVANVNFFSKVTVGRRGRNVFPARRAQAGQLRRSAVRDAFPGRVLTCQHPLDPEPAYHPRYVRLARLRQRSGAERGSVPRSAARKMSAASATPRCCTCHDGHHGGKHARPRGRRVERGRSRGRAVDGYRPQGPVSSAYWTWRATRRSTRCSTTPPIRRALQRLGHDPGAGESVPDDAARACCRTTAT